MKLVPYFSSEILLCCYFICFSFQLSGNNRFLQLCNSKKEKIKEKRRNKLMNLMIIANDIFFFSFGFYYSLICLNLYRKLNREMNISFILDSERYSASKSREHNFFVVSCFVPDLLPHFTFIHFFSISFSFVLQKNERYSFFFYTYTNIFLFFIFLFHAFAVICFFSAYFVLFSHFFHFLSFYIQ